MLVSAGAAEHLPGKQRVWRPGADLPHMRFHDLRHTSANLLLAEGVHPTVAQEMMGHSSISVTMDTCSHVMPTRQRQSAESLDRVFGAH